jgi:aspartyl-tRNA(Asn)/glutamyl-tRNA(Gln) amidotransferase subunit B
VGRQAAILSDGGKVTQETRHWHEDTGITTSGREKSDAEDYRYFPEPDLVPVAPSREWVAELKATSPSHPPYAVKAAGGVGLLRPGDA